MNKVVVFAIRDIKVDAYLNPWFAPTRGAGIRAFEDGVNSDPQAPIALHPSDYELFELGLFNQVTAEFELLDRPRSLCTAESVIRQKSLLKGE